MAVGADVPEGSPLLVFGAGARGRREGKVFAGWWLLKDPQPEATLKKSQLIDIALWVPTLFLAYVFFRQGTSKFDDTSGWSRAFAVWHFPVWFRVLIGCLESGAAALLLTRRTASVGAAIIAVVMLGGMGTHIYWGQPGQVRSEVVPLALSLIIFFGRRRHLLAMGERRGWFAGARAQRA